MEKLKGLEDEIPLYENDLFSYLINDLLDKIVRLQSKDTEV